MNPQSGVLIRFQGLTLKKPGEIGDREPGLTVKFAGTSASGKVELLVKIELRT